MLVQFRQKVRGAGWTKQVQEIQISRMRRPAQVKLQHWPPLFKAFRRHDCLETRVIAQGQDRATEPRFTDPQMPVSIGLYRLRVARQPVSWPKIPHHREPCTVRKLEQSSRGGVSVAGR